MNFSAIQQFSRFMIFIWEKKYKVICLTMFLKYFLIYSIYSCMELYYANHFHMMWFHINGHYIWLNAWSMENRSFLEKWPININFTFHPSFSWFHLNISFSLYYSTVTKISIFWTELTTYMKLYAIYYFLNVFI